MFKRILSTLVALVFLLSGISWPLPAFAAAETIADQPDMSFAGERIYQIMTDRFYDGDPTNNATGEALRYQEVTAEDMTYMKGGDWQGIID